MARISISDLYLGEGPGQKYGGILNAVMQDVFNNGVPEGCDERTWIELLTVILLSDKTLLEDLRDRFAPDEAEDAGGLDARQGRQRSMAQSWPQRYKMVLLDNSIMQTFLTAIQMAEQGDEVSELTDAASPCCISETDERTCSGAQCAPPTPQAVREEVRK